MIASFFTQSSQQILFTSICSSKRIKQVLNRFRNSKKKNSIWLLMPSSGSHSRAQSESLTFLSSKKLRAQGFLFAVLISLPGGTWTMAATMKDLKTLRCLFLCQRLKKQHLNLQVFTTSEDASSQNPFFWNTIANHLKTTMVPTNSLDSIDQN